MKKPSTAALPEVLPEVQLLALTLEPAAVCKAGVILGANEAFAHYLGYEPGELSGRRLADFIQIDAVNDQENDSELGETQVGVQGGVADFAATRGDAARR